MVKRERDREKKKRREEEREEKNRADGRETRVSGKRAISLH